MDLAGASWRKTALHVFAVLAVFVVAGALLFTVGMSLLFSHWSDEPGRQLAGRIRAAGSPLIRQVVFRPQTMIDPPEVHVIVQPG